MSDLIEKYKYRPTPDSKAVTIRIFSDSDPQNPREWDQPTHFVGWHRRYTLGDEPEFGNGRKGDPGMTPQEYQIRMASRFDPHLEEWLDEEPARLWDKPATPLERQEMLQAFEERKAARIERILDRHYLMLNVFMYEHGGVALSTSSFIGKAQHAEWDSGQVGFIYIERKKALAFWNPEAKDLGSKRKATYLKYMEGEIETYSQYLNGEVYGYTVKRKGEEIDSCWGMFGWEYVKQEAEAAAQAYLQELPAKKQKEVTE